MARPERSPFLREKNSDLVNLESYLPYLIDPPETAPITLPFNNQGPFVHQHVYFQEAAYRQDGVPPEDKDWGLVWMRNISYNQVIMRRHMELKLHQEHEEDVAPPSSETNSYCLEDYNQVDIIGAATVGKNVALNPMLQPIILPDSGRPARVDDLSPEERANFFDQQLEGSLAALEQPLVTPQRVITSALKRMSALLNSAELESLANKRLEEDVIYYPLRMPKVAKLYHLSNELVIRAFEVQTIETPEELAA